MENIEYWPTSSISSQLSYKIPALLRLLTRQYEKYYWGRGDVTSVCKSWHDNDHTEFDLVIANDVIAMLVALHIAGDSPVLLDAHEYSPRQGAGLLWEMFNGPFMDWQCKKYLGKVALMSTVNNSLSREFEREYGRPSIVIYNAPAYQKLEPQPVGSDMIRMVHHGGAARQRGLEEIINMLDYMDDKYTLDFYLVAADQNSVEYLGELKMLSEKFAGRVRFRDAVPTDKIAEELNPYDIGIALIQPTNFNNAHSLSNKFFEFIQARLALATGPTPDMKELVEIHDIGVVAEDFTARSMARKISDLSINDINRIKQNVHDKAEVLSFKSSAKLLLQSVEELVGD
jgi:hypothetical protein